MQFIAAFKAFIPEFHAYSDDERRYNIGATWTDNNGLQDYHNLQVKYVRNSERLALQGDPQPDGSWKYVEPSGAVHIISAERARHFMEKTHEHATLMCGMIERLKQAGLADQFIDTSAEPA